MARIIGIDYGEKRVGVAISDEGQSFAFPRTVLKNDVRLLDTLAQLAQDEGAVLFVIGESENPRGGMNTIMRRITIFAEAIQVRTGLHVEFVNEAYSSAEARRAFEEKIKSRKDATMPIDAAAAAIILQMFIDRRRVV
jgi:putative holliday junction resolvase